MPVTVQGGAPSTDAPRPRSVLSRSFVPLLIVWAIAALVRFAITPAGARAEYFTTPDWTGPPSRVVVDTEPSTAQISRSWRYAVPDSFSVQWFGWLFVERAGDYTFTISALGRAQLAIDNQPLILADRDGVNTGTIALTPGSHAVLARYAQPRGESHFEWTWARAAGSQHPVPAWRLSTRRAGYAVLILGRGVNALWLPLTIALVVCGAGLLLARLREDGVADDPAASGRPRISTAAAVGAAALFAALAVVHTWPLASAPSRLSRNDNADTVLNEWTMAWVAHEAPRHPLAVFDANIFYPERQALAFSESLLVQSAMAMPVLWLGGSPVLAYNLVLIAGFALTGWAMCLVVTAWTGDWFAGAASGAIVAFNAHTLTRLPHIQAQHAAFLLLALFALDALLRRPRWTTAAWLAAWTALQGAASVYLLVFTMVALGVSVLVRPEDWTGRRFRFVAPKLAGAALLGGLALWPVLRPYWHLHRAGFARSLDEAAFYAASAGDYLAGQSRLFPRAAHTTALFPGAAALVLAAIAVAAIGVRNRRTRMAVAFGAAGVLLSLGPAVTPGYDLLYSAVPLVGAIRVSGRFGYLAIVAVAMLAGFGVAWLHGRLASRPWLAGGVATVLVAAVAFEPMAAPISYTAPAPIPTIYRQVSADAIVAELPFPPPAATFRNAPALLHSTANWRPLVNGYSGFVPPSYVSHYEALRDFPDSRAFEGLRGIGVTDVFVHLDQLAADAAARLDGDPRLRRVAAEGDIVLYRLLP